MPWDAELCSAGRTIASALHGLLGNRKHDYAVGLVGFWGGGFQDYAVGGLGEVGFCGVNQGLCGRDLFCDGRQRKEGRSPTEHVHVNLILFLCRDSPVAWGNGSSASSID